VLAARCGHFKAMFSSGMRESTESKVMIPNTPHAVFLALLEFLYTDSVDSLKPEEAIQLFSVAEM
jgi:RCC1 and BTB domain-containing protein